MSRKNNKMCIEYKNLNKILHRMCVEDGSILEHGPREYIRVH